MTTRIRREQIQSAFLTEGEADLLYSDIAHAHGWTEITDKPSTFAPDAHSHVWADLTDPPATYAPSAHGHGWTEITDKPTVFPPDSHLHDDRYYTETEIGTLLGGYIAKSVLGANSIIKADSANTPIELTVGASTLVGRGAAGSIAALNASDARTVLGLATTDNVQFLSGTFPAGLKVDASTDAPLDALFFRNSSSGASALARASFRNDVGEILIIDAFSSGYSGDIAGVALAGMVRILARTGSSSLFLGTEHSSDPIHFATNNTPRMTILGGGNVGIGTAAPAQKFHVYDTANFIARFEANGANSYSGFQVQANQSTVHLNAQTFGSTFAGTQFGLNRAGTSSLFSDGSLLTLGTKTNHDLIFGTNNAERMRIAADGNVGIGGTPSYPYRLLVEDAGGKFALSVIANSCVMRMSNTNTPNKEWYFGNSAPGLSNAGDYFSLGRLDGTWQEFLRVTSGGNVGIGTSNPYNKLHIRDSAVSGSSQHADDLLVLEKNGNSNFNFIAGGTGNSGFLFSDNVRARGIFRYLHATDSMEFWTAGTQQVTILSDGKVGIGHATPDVLLTLGGSSRVLSFTGSVDVAGSPFGTIEAKYSSSYEAAARIRFVRPLAYWANEGEIQFYTNPGGSAGNTLAQRMVIDRLGNVGIGTSSPGQMLQVNGASATAVGIRTPWAANAYGQLRFETGTGESSIRSYVPGDSTNGLQFFTYGSSAETVKMTILGGGNVGIGTTGPAGKLDINQSSTTAAIPVLKLTQADVSEEFIEFVSTSAANNTNPISTTAVGGYAGKLRINVNGTYYWIPFYTS